MIQTSRQRTASHEREAVVRVDDSIMRPSRSIRSNSPNPIRHYVYTLTSIEQCVPSHVSRLLPAPSDFSLPSDPALGVDDAALGSIFFSIDREGGFDRPVSASSASRVPHLRQEGGARIVPRHFSLQKPPHHTHYASRLLIHGPDTQRQLTGILGCLRQLVSPGPACSSKIGTAHRLGACKAPN